MIGENVPSELGEMFDYHLERSLCCDYNTKRPKSRYGFAFDEATTLVTSVCPSGHERACHVISDHRGPDYGGQQFETGSYGSIKREQKVRSFSVSLQRAQTTWRVLCYACRIAVVEDVITCSY